MFQKSFLTIEISEKSAFSRQIDEPHDVDRFLGSGYESAGEKQEEGTIPSRQRNGVCGRSEARVGINETGAH